VAKEADMKINLTGEYLRRYRRLRRTRLFMPDKRTPTSHQRIRKCHLTPRQMKKMEEMEKED
jgi:hypothetical protein